MTVVYFTLDKSKTSSGGPSQPAVVEQRHGRSSVSLRSRSRSRSSSRSSDSTESTPPVILLFDFEENGGADRGRKGKEKAGTWSEGERSKMMFDDESKQRMDWYNERWGALCNQYGVQAKPLPFDHKPEFVALYEETEEQSQQSLSSSADESYPMGERSSTSGWGTSVSQELEAVVYVEAIEPEQTSNADTKESDACPVHPPVTATSYDVRSRMCVICNDLIQGKILTAPCGHVYDENCMMDAFFMNMDDESVFPPRCCSDIIPYSIIQQHLHQDIVDIFEAKYIEYTTVNKLYCSNPKCSEFLGSGSDKPCAISCSSCSRKTCSVCRQEAHPAGTPCKPDHLVTQAFITGQSKGWRRCPSCRQLVERNMGCSHMSCRCRAHWCYDCGLLTSECSCYVNRGFFNALGKWALKKVGVERNHRRAGYLLRSEAVYIGQSVSDDRRLASMSRAMAKSWKVVSGKAGRRAWTATA